MFLDIQNIPVIVVNSLGLTLIVTLGLGYYYEHITYIIPYISDSGTYPPESCIFGQVLNIIAALIGYALYIRYLQIKSLLKENNAGLAQLNKLNFLIGLLAAFGVSLVANFQETVLLTVHWVGATLAFGGGSLYQIIQTILAAKVDNIFQNSLLWNIQRLLSVLSSTTFIVFFVSGMMSMNEFQGNDMTKWKPEDGAFELHLVSTCFEWVCASSIMAFIYLLKWEFARIEVKGIKVKPKSGSSRDSL